MVKHAVVEAQTGAPLVSVIIPTCRRPGRLRESVRSALASEYPAFEVVVVDDSGHCAEREENARIMAELKRAHTNLVYVAHETQRNGSVARNTGIRTSKGAYLMFLDDDDVFRPGKMAAQAAFLQSHDATWAACYTRYVDEWKGNVVAQSGECRQGWLLREELGRNLFVHAGSNLMVRREVVEALGGFDECFERNQDVEFLVRLLKRWQLGFVDVEGLVVRLHPHPGVDMEAVTKRFVERFRQEIDALPEADRRAVYRMLGLQRVRAVLRKRRGWAQCAAILRETGLCWRDVARYGKHLAWRRVRRISCGYDMDRLQGEERVRKRKGSGNNCWW